MGHPFFLLGFCLLLVHEMDAVRCEEWRVLPLTAWMDDEAGYLAFTALHVPLYGLLLWGLFGGDRTNHTLVLWLDAFLILHVLLHLVYVKHPQYRFRTPFSWALILGAGACGALDLAMPA